MAHATTPLVEQLELLLLLTKLLLRVMHLLYQLPVVRCVLEAVGGERVGRLVRDGVAELERVNDADVVTSRSSSPSSTASSVSDASR